MKKQSKPKFYIRPDDYEIFSLNDDKETYSIDVYKTRWPLKHFHHKYSEDLLIKNGFFVGRKKDFALYKKQKQEYYDLLSGNGCGCGDDE